MTTKRNENNSSEEQEHLADDDPEVVKIDEDLKQHSLDAILTTLQQTYTVYHARQLAPTAP